VKSNRLCFAGRMISGAENLPQRPLKADETKEDQNPGGRMA
jgi:hypothetical protein